MTVDPSHSRQIRAEGILVAATALYARDEAEHVTVDQIAARAGVAPGAIHVHFGSQERLHLAVVERALELCLSYTSARPWSPSPVERMKRMGEAFVAFALAHPDEFRIVSERSTVHTGNPEYAAQEARIAALLQRDIFQLATDAQAAMDAGLLRNMPVQQVVSYFWALWSGLIAMSTRADAFRVSPEQVRPMLEDAARVLERGLAPESAVDGAAAAPPARAA
jgi:TetR/AcrR family transcriptional regulator